MKRSNVIQNKTFEFSVRIIRLYQFLVREKREYILSKQLLRCGTSIGANIEEGVGAQSDKDFYTKFTIAYKEARETHYWIRFLTDTDYIDIKQKQSLIEDLEEILKINTSI